MNRIWLCVAILMASAVAAPAQKALDADRPSVSSTSRAQSDDDRRTQGALGMAKLAQDNPESEGEMRERLRETADIDQDNARAVVAAHHRERDTRAAMMRTDQHAPQ